jgi:SAM-dependent methyltransferase
MIEVCPVATKENFNEEAYLLANPDVKVAVESGACQSGLIHFNSFGVHEQRRLDNSRAIEFRKAKENKKKLIRPLLRDDLPCVESERSFDFLSKELSEQFSIVETPNVSSNGYDDQFIEVIKTNKIVLDCGAGFRDIYIDNVVNFEIAGYPSTDVLGVGEVLPFKSSTFDAVLSSAVLEHVKDPWLCASEILRVLKPGGELICCVPFLQPLHGYPHHYYNMSGQGLRNLFGDNLDVQKHYVPPSTSPIWSLAWILQSWSQGLVGSTKDDFMQMKVADFMESPGQYLDKDFVNELSEDKNFELASATVLRGRKK